jgi:hypothetical protein
MKSIEDLEDESESAYFQSQEFQDHVKAIIERETWGKGLPKVYMDEEGWIVKHWKDGRIERLEKIF